VSSVSSNDVVLDGNFDGNLAAGKILVFAEYDEATAGQKSTNAFYADQTTQTIDASSDPPFRYGEP
jgi:hypothetical protein